ncbi:MAG: ATP-binding protein, partial [Planctomycetota bacterium]
AHERGIVHGDVKPANVFVAAGGLVKLGDFGLARALGSSSRITHGSAELVGTPVYMAPEVILGERPRFCSDLWSAGVVLYQMLAGRLPFDGPNLQSLFFAIQNSAPLPLPARTPPELARLALWLLAKLPQDRPASAASLASSLDRMSASVTVRSADPSATFPPAPKLVGREEEAARLRGLLDAVGPGRGRSLLVTGDAGIGTSALFRDAEAAARSRGFRWIEATVTPNEGLLRPLVQAVRQAVADDSSHHIEVPMALRADAAGPNSRNRVPAGSGGQLTHDVVEMFRRLAATRPAVVLVEDAQHADAQELRLLNGLIRRLADAPVLLAVTCRTNEPGGAASGSTRVAQALAELPALVRLEPRPLPREAMRRLLEDRAGGAAPSAEVADRIIHLADGNPLHAVELLRHLKESGAAQLVDGRLVPGPAWARTSLPERFHDLVTRRLDGLDDEQRALLDVAAVDGLAFDGDALAAALKQPLLHVLRLLQRLYRERGLVVPRAAGYRFGHALVREVVYSEVAPEMRRALHQELALHYEARAAPDLDDPERVAVHWERAGDRARAKPFLLRAAEGAAKRQELLRTISLCERAGLVPGRIQPSDVSAHAGPLLDLATCLGNVGRVPDAVSVYAAIESASRSAGDELLRLKTLVSRSALAAAYAGAAELNEPALREAAEKLPTCRERVLAYYRLGSAARSRGRNAEARELLVQAQCVSEELEDSGLLASIMDQLGTLAQLEGRSLEAEALYADSARISWSVGQLANSAISEVNRVLSTFSRGAIDGLDGEVHRAIATLESEGVASFAAHARLVAADLRLAQGDTAGAERELAAAYPVLVDSGTSRGRSAGLFFRAMLLIIRGDLRNGETCLDQAASLAERLDDVESRLRAACLRIHFLCHSGRAGEAEEEARRAFELVRTLAAPTTCANVMLWLAEAAGYGLGEAVLREARSIVESRPMDAEGRMEVARRALDGARALAAGAGHE